MLSNSKQFLMDQQIWNDEKKSIAISQECFANFNIFFSFFFNEPVIDLGEKVLMEAEKFEF